jgi:hypothetical protein
LETTILPSRNLPHLVASSIYKHVVGNRIHQYALAKPTFDQTVGFEKVHLQFIAHDYHYKYQLGLAMYISTQKAGVVNRLNYVVCYQSSKRSSRPLDHPYRADTDIVTPSMKLLNKQEVARFLCGETRSALRCRKRKAEKTRSARVCSNR